jgi:hypothetical protein
MVSTLDLQGLFKSIASSLRQVLGHERTTLALYDEQIGDLLLFAMEARSSEIRTPAPMPPPNATPGQAFEGSPHDGFQPD